MADRWFANVARYCFRQSPTSSHTDVIAFLQVWRGGSKRFVMHHLRLVAVVFSLAYVGQKLGEKWK